MHKTEKCLTKFGKGDIIKMTAEQYNNVIKCTMKKVDFPKTADSFQEARAIFKNLGVALPQGNGREVFTTLQTNDYMGWRACTKEEAQRYANNGIATIGISKDRIVVLTAIHFNIEPCMKDDDYCADLDAENIYHFIVNRGSSISALNYYFSTVPHTFVTRSDLFLSYLSYDFVEQKVLSYLLLANMGDPMSTLKEQYYDTYNFLRSLQDRLAHLAQY